MVSSLPQKMKHDLLRKIIPLTTSKEDNVSDVKSYSRVTKKCINNFSCIQFITVEFKPPYGLSKTIIARYVTAQPPTQGADAGMYDASSEIHKLSTWQQVPQRGNPFCDKGGLREQRQSESCSKRHHGTREEDFSGRQRVFETLRDCTSISQQT